MKTPYVIVSGQRWIITTQDQEIRDMEIEIVMFVLNGKLWPSSWCTEVNLGKQQKYALYSVYDLNLIGHIRLR